MSIELTPTTTTTAYLGLIEADSLAGSILTLSAWSAETSTPQRKLAALVQASDEIDALWPYQGRRYQDNQVRQFPRIPYDLTTVNPLDFYRRDSSIAEVIWDWDEATETVVVPRAVKIATLIQADDILDGTRRRQLAGRDGLTAQSVGSQSESYDTAARGREMIVHMGARQLLERYRLRSGKIL